jgi:hypothetical protein
MPPTPSSAQDDILDLGDLDMKPASGKSKAAAAESDFEKELEALFADELASSDEKPASAPPVGGSTADEDILLLDDLVADAPAASEPSAVPAAEEDILDLGDFAAEGALDITPPDETPGGKDGGIDAGGLDDLIAGLGEPQKSAPAPEPDHAVVPLDSTDMSELLESIDVPAAQKTAASAQPLEAEPVPAGAGEEDLLELSLGDLVEEAAPAAAAPAAAEPAAPEAEPMDLGDLDLTLPDLSDPEPGRDLVAEQDQADLGGELNLSLGDLAEEAPAAAGTEADQGLGIGDLDMTGLAEAAPAEPALADVPEAEPEPSLDAAALLDAIPDAPPVAPVLAEAAAAAVAAVAAAAAVEPTPAEPVVEAASPASTAPAPTAAEAIEPEPIPVASAAPVGEPVPAAPVLPLADAALAAMAAAPEAAPAATVDAALREQLEQASRMLAELKDRFADLTTQVAGGGMAIMRLEGNLAEKDRALAELQTELKASQSEAAMLRGDLSDLRAQLEETLRVRAQAAEEAGKDVSELKDRLISVEDRQKDATAVKERLAIVEDRQAQIDREVHTEIARAVPREAARVIREEIAALAASMREE